MRKQAISTVSSASILCVQCHVLARHLYEEHRQFYSTQYISTEMKCLNTFCILDFKYCTPQKNPRTTGQQGIIRQAMCQLSARMSSVHSPYAIVVNNKRSLTRGRYLIYSRQRQCTSHGSSRCWFLSPLLHGPSLGFRLFGSLWSLLESTHPTRV